MTYGSLIFKDNIDKETNPSIERLLKAGAIVHARSAAPEFSCAPYTHSKLWGITRTPWNLRYSCGGSSGGAGASLAAGTTTLASGSDIGGSIRIPASMSGVVGYKPPFGRNPDPPPFNLDQYCHIGPLARTVADFALVPERQCRTAPEDIAIAAAQAAHPRQARRHQGLEDRADGRHGGYDVEPDVARPAPPPMPSGRPAPSSRRSNSAGTARRSPAGGRISAPSSRPGSPPMAEHRG